MGFTPLEGLVMATRSGSVDPGLLLWLLEHGGLTASELGQVLEHQAGLKGLSGTSGDFREVLAARNEDADSALAFDVLVHRLVREIGSMTASAQGLDLLIFTGGIGEHSPEVRALVAEDLGFLGVRLADDLNAGATSDADISGDGAAVRTVVIEASEASEIARETSRVISP